MYSVIGQTVYASIYNAISNNYGIQTYNSITQNGASVFTVQSGQAISGFMPTNTYEGNVYYAKYISYMNFSNVDYLFTSVFKNTLTIEIYVLNTTTTFNALTQFGVALSGNKMIENDTLI